MSTQEPPESPAHASGYLAFLIRMWKDHGASSWRASLENPHTGERASFAELSSLFEYLLNCTSESSIPAAPTRPKGSALGKPRED